jgi:hypothetical protein
MPHWWHLHQASFGRYSNFRRTADTAHCRSSEVNDVNCVPRWDGVGVHFGISTPASFANTPQQVAKMREEMTKLREFHELAKSIKRNSKGA